jgi:hypothetical protein
MRLDVFLANEPNLSDSEAARFRKWIEQDADRNYRRGIWRATLNIFRKGRG